MNKNRDISVVVTGQIREPSLFIETLEQLSHITNVEEIILATWNSEALKFSTLLSELTDRYGLKVAAVPEPDDWPGNLLGQMVSLYVGLREANRNNYILKTRTDVFIETEALHYAFKQNLDISLPTTLKYLKPPFEKKIIVWGVEATVPFYIHDLFFFGKHSDISKLVNMDIRYDVLYEMSKEKIHIRRFLHPFIHEFPIFEKFLYVGHVLGSTHEFPNDYRYNVLEELLKDDYYILILALYYKLIGYFFSNDWGSNTVFRWNNIPDQVVFNDGMTMSELLLGNRDLKALLLRGNSLFQGITKRSYGSCPIGKKFDNALDYLENLKDIRNAGLENGVDDFINRTISTGENALRNMREELKNIK